MAITIKEQEIALAEYLSDKFPEEFWKYPYGDNLIAIAAARKKLINTPKLCYTYCNHLRDIIAKKPETLKNKVGQALVSDYDIVNAEPEEHLEALVRAMRLWQK